MKKTGLLNQPISTAIAGLGHTDMLVVADAGLPIPTGPTRIDLALTQGIPPFVDTLRTILIEMQVERAVIAEEMATVSPSLYQAVTDILGDTPIEMCPHEAFKTMTGEAKAVVRTGEFTPYANIILVSGVVF